METPESSKWAPGFSHLVRTVQMKLPMIRSGERADFKRCQRRWYWAWRRGLVARIRRFGALDMGTWVHEAFAAWYGPGRKRNGDLVEHYLSAYDRTLWTAEQDNAPDYVIQSAEEIGVLGEEMLKGYSRKYGDDPEIDVLGAEIPLEFVFAMELENGVWKPVATHKLKPDVVLQDRNGDVWLGEHKTAKSVQTEHLVLDDQARPYGAMAERALRKMGVIKDGQQFRGIMYNFLRKALEDQRPRNEKGQYLNKDGSISKNQPPPYYVRKHITMTSKARRITLLRVQRETITITDLTLKLRNRQISFEDLLHTPHKSCPKLCPFFTMCVATEEGTDTRTMEETMFIRRDPYQYEEESTEERLGFEIT